MIVRAMKYCTMALFCLSLAGCFSSKEALINDANADKPFKRASLQLESNGQPGTFDLELRGSSYAFTNLSGNLKDSKGEDKLKMFFYKVQDNLFIIQGQDGETPASYDLYIVKLNGNEFTMDRCDAYKDETLAKAGVQPGEFGICTVTSLTQLTELAKIPADVPDKRAAAGKILQMEK